MSGGAWYWLTDWLSPVWPAVYCPSGWRDPPAVWGRCPAPLPGHVPPRRGPDDRPPPHGQDGWRLARLGRGQHGPRAGRAERDGRGAQHSLQPGPVTQHRPELPARHHSRGPAAGRPAGEEGGVISSHWVRERLKYRNLVLLSSSALSWLVCIIQSWYKILCIYNCGSRRVTALSVIMIKYSQSYLEIKPKERCCVMRRERERDRDVCEQTRNADDVCRQFRRQVCLVPGVTAWHRERNTDWESDSPSPPLPPPLASQPANTRRPLVITSLTDSDWLWCCRTWTRCPSCAAPPRASLAWRRGRPGPLTPARAPPQRPSAPPGSPLCAGGVWTWRRKWDKTRTAPRSRWSGSLPWPPPPARSPPSLLHSNKTPLCILTAHLNQAATPAVRPQLTKHSRPDQQPTWWCPALTVSPTLPWCQAPARQTRRSTPAWLSPSRGPAAPPPGTTRATGGT